MVSKETSTHMTFIELPGDQGKASRKMQCAVFKELKILVFDSDNISVINMQ